MKDDKGEVKLNGRLTLGENTADNGGLKLAYMALTDIMGNTPVKEIDGYTPQQRFSWPSDKSGARTSPTRKRASGRSPIRIRLDEWRVNGAVQNSAAFQQAFGCKAGQAMVRENACRVW